MTQQSISLFIRGMLSDRYSVDRGRPAQEPEFMFKICLLEYLYNLSDVQVIEHIRVNLAYRWFLGLNLDGDLPDDSTISYFSRKSCRASEVSRNLSASC
ncbi:hypothetical protein GCM10020331_007230 [Ectobacillus funiculus]